MAVRDPLWPHWRWHYLMTLDPLQKLEQDIGHTFKNRNILQRALCHSSYSGSKISYERLEFPVTVYLDFDGRIFLRSFSR